LDSFEVKILDGHKIPRAHTGPSVLDRYLHSTVSSVKYSSDGAFLFSGGYDETVKVWVDDGVLVNSINIGSRVEQIATSATHTSAAAAVCQNANVKIISLNSEGNLVSEPLTLSPQKENMAGSCVVWCNSHRPNYIIVGYDNCVEKPKSNTGDLIIFDAVAGKAVSKVVPGANRQLDIWHSAHSTFFATACVNSRPRHNAQTLVRLYSLGPPDGRARMQVEFDSAQRDINVVTTS
jgi:WD40 repeat protein